MPDQLQKEKRPRGGIELTVEAQRRLASSPRPADRHFAGELGAYLDTASPGWRTR